MDSSSRLVSTLPELGCYFSGAKAIQQLTEALEWGRKALKMELEAVFRLLGDRSRDNKQTGPYWI